MNEKWILSKGNGPLILGPDPWLEADPEKMRRFDKFFGQDFKNIRATLDELARTAYLISPDSENVEYDYGFCLNAHETFLSTIDSGAYGEHLFDDWDYVSLLEIMVFIARNIVRDFNLASTMEDPIQTVVKYELDAMGLLDVEGADLVSLVGVNINRRSFTKLGKGNFLEFKDPAGHGLDCRHWSLIHMQNTWGIEYEWPEDCKAYANLYTERMSD